MLVQHWGLPSSCTSLPADNSAAASSRASSWVNKTRRKTKVGHPSSVFCQTAVWIGQISPTSLWKGLKRFKFLFSLIDVNTQCDDRTMAFLPDIVCMLRPLCFSSWAKTSVVCRQILCYASNSGIHHILMNRPWLGGAWCHNFAALVRLSQPWYYHQLLCRGRMET